MGLLYLVFGSHFYLSVRHKIDLLPKQEYMKYLSFIYNLTILLHENANEADILFHYSDRTLTIKADQSLYHAKEAIALLEKPHDFSIVIDDINGVPEYEF